MLGIAMARNDFQIHFNRQATLMQTLGGEQSEQCGCVLNLAWLTVEQNVHKPIG